MEVAFRDKVAVEVGCGNGLVALHLAYSGLDVHVTDLNLQALEHVSRQAEKLGLQVTSHHTDLIEGVDGPFDIIVFNPPYLPDDPSDPSLGELDRLALVGGKGGWEAAARGLGSFVHKLSPGGRIYVLVMQENANRLVTSFSELVFSKVQEGSSENERLVVFKVKKE